MKRSNKYKTRVLERSTKAAEIEVYERCDGEWEKCGVPIKFTWQDAERAGLTTKATYKAWPSDMLYARAMACAFRTYAPDCMNGVAMYIPEEIEGSGLKTDGPTGELVPDAVVEIKPPTIDSVKKLIAETKADMTAIAKLYGNSDVTKLKADQLIALEQFLLKKKRAM